MNNQLEKIRNQRVLVTGGLGFVGHNLVKTLVNNYQCTVIVVDDCSNSSPDALGETLGQVNFHKISVLDTELFFPLLDDVAYVFHLACKQISASGKNPVDDLKINAESTLRILEYLKQNKLPNLKRFIYTSSCSIYGSASRIPTTENEPTNVISHYAATKLLGENYTLIYNKYYDLPTTSVRYSNVYGYGQSPRNPYCGVLGKFVHNALVNRPLSIFGDGEQTRDYTFISDAVEATLLSAVHPKALGENFNVGTGVETSVNNLVKFISEIIDKTKIEYLPERDIDNIRRRSVDIEKIHQRLGWSPRINIKTGISETIKWYKSTL